MKLVRFGDVGQERPGMIDSKGVIRDLSSHLNDLSGDALDPAQLSELSAIDPASLPTVPNGTRLGAPVAGTRSFIAVGLNYEDHARETNQPIPAEPILFNKTTNCIVGPNDDVMIPKESSKTDWEVELAVVIGRRVRYVSEAEALSHVAGYCVCNDISERAFQMERGGQWMKGKGCETFGPLGPWLVTADEVPDVQKLDMWLEINGRRVQNGSTATMIFGVATLVSYISQFMVLEPGDVITTGTPPGVGMGMKPPVFLRAGDELRLGIQSLGEQRQRIVAFRP